MADICEVDTHISKRYDVKKRLGKGAYGIVWKAVDKKNGSVVAVKKIFDAFRNQTDAQRTFREIMFLQHFGDHPNIIRLLDVHRADNDKDIYLIFEYMDTDLHNVIKRGNILKEVHKQYILYQLFRATKYLHSGNVIHRDQKPSNILLDADCRCKIADFGLARSLVQDADEGQADSVMTDYVATRWYRAPEILLASKWYTKGVDMWSLGCILGEILLGQPLFPGTSTLNQLEKIMASIPPPTREDIQSLCTGYASSLLEKSMMVPRVPLRVLLASAPADAVDLLEKLLVLNPHKRLTAEQALEHPYVKAFHKPEREPALDHDVVPTLSDAIQLSVEEYRNKLYEVIAEQSGRINQNHLKSPSKFSSSLRPPESSSDKGTSTTINKNSLTRNIPKTKSSGDLISVESHSSSSSKNLEVVQHHHHLHRGGSCSKKVSSTSAPGDIVPSSRTSSYRSSPSAAATPPDRNKVVLMTRHSDDHVLRRETSKSFKTPSVNKSISSSNLPRSYSGHALVKMSTSSSESSAESTTCKGSPHKANGNLPNAQLLASHFESHCNLGRPLTTTLQQQHQAAVSSSITATRFASRYGNKEQFSRSLDNPIITRAVPASRSVSAEKVLSRTSQKGQRPSQFGKRQFTSLNNVSNLAAAGGVASPGVLTSPSPPRTANGAKFTAAHGTITASALQELRASIK